MTLPYSSATSGQRAIDDIRNIIQAFGCSKFAPMEDFATGEITAIETGILSFDAAFLGQILLPDGRTIHDRVAQSDMLPALEGPKG